MPKAYSTVEVARLLGISKQTLLRWLWAGKLKEPKRHTNGGQDVRLWSEADFQRAVKFKEQNYQANKKPSKR